MVVDRSTNAAVRILRVLSHLHQNVHRLFGEKTGDKAKNSTGNMQIRYMPGLPLRYPFL